MVTYLQSDQTDQLPLYFNHLNSTHSNIKIFRTGCPCKQTPGECLYRKSTHTEIPPGNFTSPTGSQEIHLYHFNRAITICNKPYPGNKMQHVTALSEKTANPYKISTGNQRPQPPTKTREITWYMYFTSMTPMTASPGY